MKKEPILRELQEVKEKLDLLMNSGSKSPQAERILFTKIDTLNWVLSLTDKLK